MNFNKNLSIGLLSCALESYTASMYVFAGPELKSQIFPYLSLDSATFFHYLILALGLFCYPFGGRLFGYLADKLGRKKALTYSSLGLAISTGLLGLVPLGLTGWLVYIPAILFTLLYCMQHFCSGGDYSSSAIFTVEHVNKNKESLQIYYSGLACVMSVIGLIMGQFMGGSGLWRLGCLTAFLGALFAFYIRKKSDETPIFLSKMLTQNNNQHYLEKYLVFIFAGFLCAVYYYVFIFLTPHLYPDEGYVLRDVNICYFLLYAVALWFGGMIASKSNHLVKTLQNFCFILLLLFIQFGLILFLIDSQSQNYLLTVSILIGILVFFMGLVISPQHALYLKLFPNKKRCQNIIMNFTLGCAVIGGVTPFFCKLIYTVSGNLGLTVFWPLLWTGILLVTMIFYSGSPLKSSLPTPSRLGDR